MLQTEGEATSWVGVSDSFIIEELRSTTDRRVDRQTDRQTCQQTSDRLIDGQTYKQV